MKTASGFNRFAMAANANSANSNFKVSDVKVANAA